MTESYRAHADYVLYWSLIGLRDEAFPPYPDAAGGSGGDFHYQLERLLDLVNNKINELAPRVRHNDGADDR